MKETAALDLESVRARFPGLEAGWIYLDNAGGSQVLGPVADRVREYLLETPVQHGASYEPSRRAEERVRAAESALAELVSAADPSEIVVGSTTSSLLRVLADSFGRTLRPGDEIIVTNCDHEANIGPWVELERYGAKVRFWKVDPDSLRLESAALAALLTDRTRLVAAAQVSNVLGEVNPIREWVDLAHEAGALFCVDGVAYAPHRLVDVRAWDVDFYTVSLYKVFGPHLALLYGKRRELERLPRHNHFFLEREIPYKFQPGNRNFELTYGAGAIVDYLCELGGGAGDRRRALATAFERIARHEAEIGSRLLEWLATKPRVRVIGPPAMSERRVPTISFVVDGVRSSTIPPRVDEHGIGIRWGDFYARRLVDDLGLSKQGGVVRVSMVHYNTLEEMDRLVAALDPYL